MKIIKLDFLKRFSNLDIYIYIFRERERDREREREREKCPVMDEILNNIC